MSGSDADKRESPCPECGCTRMHWKTKKRDHPVPVLRKYRLDAGYSVQRLADKAGVSKNTIWAIENGYQNARLSTVKLIADALKIKVTDLTDQNEPPVKSQRVLLRALRLQEIREGRRYTRTKLSDLSGVSRSAIRMAETGRHTQTPTLQKLAEALNVTIEELLGR